MILRRLICSSNDHFVSSLSCLFFRNCLNHRKTNYYVNGRWWCKSPCNYCRPISVTVNYIFNFFNRRMSDWPRHLFFLEEIHYKIFDHNYAYHNLLVSVHVNDLTFVALAGRRPSCKDAAATTEIDWIKRSWVHISASILWQWNLLSESLRRNFEL